MKILYGEELVSKIVSKAKNSNKLMYICSPYIGSETTLIEIIGTKWKEKKIDFKLLADFSNVYNIGKDSLDFILDNLKDNSRSVSQLHGKLYIFDNDAFLTSVNLTTTSFEKRHEFGVHLFAQKELKQAKDLFNYYWNKESNTLGIKSLRKENSKRDKYSPSKDEKNPSQQSIKKLWNVLSKFKSSATTTNYWLKVIGRPNDRALYNYDLINEINKGYTTFGKKPVGFKKNDIVFLGILSKDKNGNNDMTIYGKAKIKNPYREGIDDVYKYINKRSQIRLDYKNEILSELERWRYGIWMKDVIILNSDFKNALWNSKFNYKGVSIISKFSFRNGYKRLSTEEAEIVDKELTNRFEKYGTFPKKSPNSFWFKSYLTRKAHTNLMRILSLNNKIEENELPQKKKIKI